MFDIKCPDCGSSGSMSLSQRFYEGPYRCWKCRSLFTINVEDSQLKSITPLSQEEFDRWQAMRELEKKRD